MHSGNIIDRYRQMSGRELRDVLLVEYRCRDRCLLLHVWWSEHGPMYYRPRVPLSTFNSMGRWGAPRERGLPAHGGLVADFGPSGAHGHWISGDDDEAGILPSGLVIGCGHCWGGYDAANIRTDIDAAGAGRPVKRHDVWGKPVE